MCLFFGGVSCLALGETIVVNDHFDDGDIGTNTTGIGTGFNSGTWNGGAVITESGTTVTLENSEVAWACVAVTSKEGANFAAGIARFEFRGVSFSQSPNGWDWGGSTSRLAIGVKNVNTATNYDSGLWPGFYITFESDDMFTGQNTQWNGTSTLFYRSIDGVNTQLATWRFDTLNWDDWANFATTANFTPVLNLILDISSTDYSLTIEGDTVTLLSGSLEGTFASVGITNELTTGYAFAYAQTENPSIFTAIDQIVIKEGVSPWGPYDPAVLPENPEGSVGVLLSEDEAQVTLSWMAGKDPDEERGYPVNPAILGHFIFLSNGNPNDPNVHLYDYVPQVHAPDPYETDPHNEYGPIVLTPGAVYYWQIVEEILNPATGEGYPLGDPNNIPGSVWKFRTIGVAPEILTHPKSTYIDAAGNASFTITAGVTASHYRWFKVSEPEDIALTDGGVYSGTQTNTLTITGATLADEGQYYCIAYNGDPEVGGTPSDPSNAAWLWIPRLYIYYPLDTIETVGENQTTPDVASGFDMTLMNISPEGALPYLVDGVPELGGSGLFFNNSNNQDPNNAWGQYATAGAVNMEEMGNGLTISFWVKWVGNNGNWQGIINRRGSWNAADMMWRIDKNPTTGEISFERADGAGRVATTLVEDQWHQITVTYDAVSLTTRMYNNGELVATGSGFTYGTGVNSGFKLGCNNDNGSEFFYGVLDDVKVYNYVRTTEQIAKDYLAVRGEWVCNREVPALPYDYNNDCRIDLADLALFAQAWLESNRIYPD
jgi:hypothetical protein